MVDMKNYNGIAGDIVEKVDKSKQVGGSWSRRLSFVRRYRGDACINRGGAVFFKHTSAFVNRCAGGEYVVYQQYFLVINAITGKDKGIKDVFPPFFGTEAGLGTGVFSPSEEMPRPDTRFRAYGT